MADVLNVSTTPNPDAMKYTVDKRIDEMFNIASAEDAAAASNAFAQAMFGAGCGVASVFGTADFVTITRTDGADWGAIEASVRAAAAQCL